MSHNVIYHIQILWICSSETFAVIRVIDSPIRRAGRVVLLLLHFERRADNSFGYGSGYVSNFFFLHNFVSFGHRNMFDTSMALSNLWGRYDLNTIRKISFWLVTVSFLHTESNVIYLLKGPINTFISVSYTNKL